MTISEKTKIRFIAAMARREEAQEIIDAIETSLAVGAADIHSDGSVPFTANQSMGNNKITNLSAPSASSDAARKADSDAALAKAFPPNYYIVGSGSIQTAINQAITDGHNDTNCAFIVISQDRTENISLTKGGIFLTGLLSSGTHSPIRVTGQVTINGIDNNLVDNHFAIQGLEIIGPSAQPAIFFTGTNPQRLFLKDVWITAQGAGAHCIESANTGVGSMVEADDIKASHTGSGYAIHAVNGTTTIDNLESSGTIAVGRVEAGASLNIVDSECDANAATCFDVAAGGTLTLGRCVVENVATNGIGINLLAAGAVTIVGNVLFNTPLAGTGRAVNGVAGSAMYYQFIAFYPGTSTKVNPAITSVLLASTPSFT